MTRKNIVSPTERPDNEDADDGFPFGANTPPDETRTSFSDPSDPFDPESLRLSDSFSASLGVRKALVSVPARKPDKAWFVRTHPSASYRLQTAVIELKGERGGETYLVHRDLWSDLAAESTFSPRLFVTAVSRQDVLFLWPIRLPGADGRLDEWSRTSLEAADMASRSWVRVAANMALGAYDVHVAAGQIAEPHWPDVPFAQILKIAFKDKMIDSMDHPVLRRLRGEM